MSRFNKKVSRYNTNCVKWDAIEKSDIKITPFSIADSDYPTSKAVERCLRKRARHPIYGYSFPDEHYFNSIINWTIRRYDYEITTDNIIPTNGVVTSLYYAIKLWLGNSKGVIVQPPVYNPFYQVIMDNGIEIVKNKLVKEDNYFTIDYNDLEEKLKTNKMLIFCNPQNPTGRVFTYEEIKKVVELAKKHDAFILSDEIHADIILGDNKFVSANKFADIYKKIVVFTSVSKSFGLAGLKTSNVIIKDLELAEEYRAYLKLHHVGYGNLFGLTGVKASYNKGEKWLDAQNKFLTKNFELLKDFFANNYPGVGVTKTEGTFLAWLDLSYLEMSCIKMQELLKEEGIFINEGKRYSEDCKGYIRFNFACPKKQLLCGLKAVGRFLDKYQK